MVRKFKNAKNMIFSNCIIKEILGFLLNYLVYRIYAYGDFDNN